jgi:hypothetical protein
VLNGFHWFSGSVYDSRAQLLTKVQGLRDSQLLKYALSNVIPSTGDKIFDK